MLDDIHDEEYLNDTAIRQFEDYLDVNQSYNNFKPIDEFHNSYEEFPTVYHENVTDEPKKEKKEEKKKRRTDSESSSSEESSDSSSSSSSSGSASAGSGAGAAAGASSAAAADLSASQIMSTSFVAMVAVTAVVVPIIENADLEVDMDVQYSGGILTYMIELINASESSDYYAVVMEGETMILQQQIIENYQQNTLTGLKGSLEHRVEVRTGTPPLHVLKSVVIPGSPIWAEWGHMTIGYDSIDYGVYFHGDSGIAVLKLVDPNSGETLYTKVLNDGLNSDVITGLYSSHPYVLRVESETDVLLIKEVETEYSDISWSHITVVENTIDYGVDVNLSGTDVTLTLSDPSTSSVVYSMDLQPGYNSGVITDLEFGHMYEMTVATAEQTYLSETVTTDSEPIVVTVGHLTPKDNTIDYDLIVSGEGKTVTLNLYGAEGGPSIYTTSLTSGSNTGIIEGLEYSHSYLLTVSSASKTYLSESITTEAEPTKVTLDSLTSTETTIEYKVTVTGNRDVATVYLKDPTSGETLYTKELSVGTNTAIIEELQAGHTYQFTISSKTETYVSKEITTGSHPVEVTLNHLTPSDNTIDYEVTVTGNSEVVSVHLFDADGEEVYHKVLSEGVTTDTIKDLKYDYTYQFTISSETQIFISEEVAIIASITVESLEADGLIINYEMTVHGTEDATITLYRAEDDLEIGSAELPAGKTTSGSFRGTADLPIEPNKVYYVKGYIGENEYDLGSVRPESKVVTQELTADGHIISYKIEVYKSAGSELELYIYDKEGYPLTGTPLKYTITEDYEIIEDSVGEEDPYVPWGQKITLEAKMDGETYEIGEIDVVEGVVATFEADLNSIIYEITVNDQAYINAPWIRFTNAADIEDRADLELQKSDDGKYSGTVTSIGDFTFKWGATYNINVYNGGAEYQQTPVTIPARVNGTLTSNGNEIGYDITVLGAEVVGLYLYYDQQDGFWVYDLKVDPETNKITGTIVNDGDDVRIEWGVEYHVQVFVPEEEEYYDVGDVSIEPFDVTITDVSSTESSVQAKVSLNMKKYNLISVALYTDEECTDIVLNSSRAPEGSSLAYECSDLEPGKKYYIGVMYNNVRMVYSEVSTGKAASDITITGVSGLNYESANKKLVTVEGVDDQTVQYSIDNGTTWIETIPEFTDAGTYTVKYKAAESTRHYALEEESVSVSVAKVASSITLTGGQSIDYTGKTPTLEYTVQKGTGAVTFTYYATETSEDAIQPVNVGTYWATATIAENTNYTAFTTDRVSFTIKKANQTCTATAIEMEEGDTPYVKNSITGLKETPTMSYSVIEGTSYISVDSDGKLTWVGAGTAKVKASYSETDNYLAGSVEVTITTKPTAYVVGLSTNIERSYTGSAVYLVTTNDYTQVVGGTIYFYGSTTPLDPTTLGTDDWRSDSSNKGTNKGTYYVYYKIKGEEGYGDFRPDASRVVMVTIVDPSIEGATLSLDSQLGLINWSATKIVGNWSIYILNTTQDKIVGSVELPTSQSSTSGVVTEVVSPSPSYDSAAYVNKSGLTDFNLIKQGYKATTNAKPSGQYLIHTSFSDNIMNSTIAMHISEYDGWSYTLKDENNAEIKSGSTDSFVFTITQDISGHRGKTWTVEIYSPTTGKQETLVVNIPQS